MIQRESACICIGAVVYLTFDNFLLDHFGIGKKWVFIFVYLYLCICVVVFTKIQKCTTWWSFSWLVIWALTGNGESG